MTAGRLEIADASSWPESWERATFEELLRSGDFLIIQDGNHGSKYPKAEEFGPIGLPLITGAEMVSGGIDLIGAKRLNYKAAESLTKGRAKGGDVLLTHKGSIGKTAIVPTDHGGEIILNPQITLYRVAENGRIDRRFLKYFFDTRLFQDFLTRVTGISTIPTIGLKAQKTVEFVFPEVDEQREIAAVLGVLDDKIELNRKTAATLEAMARALYRSWFVDFDPVTAKSEGRAPAHMPPTTAALFPDRFGDDGLPEGWGAGTLGAVARNEKAQVQPSQVDADTPYIGLEHMPRRSLSISDWDTAAKVGSAKSAMNKGQFLFGKLRPYFHKVGLVPVAGICSTDILVIEAKKDVWRSFVGSVISSDEFVEHADASSSGTRMPRANWRDMAKFELALPPEKIARSYFDVVDPMHQTMLSIIQENQTLATLRDTLLPRLMSGELRVGEARDQVEAVA